MFRLIVAALLAALPLAPVSAATTEDNQLWINLTSLGSIKGKLVYFAELQPRLGTDISRLDQMLIRGAVGAKLSPTLTVYQGFAHVVVPIKDGRDANEERAFQQISWAILPGASELSLRTRFEQRWRSNGSDMGLRLREMLRFETPLTKQKKGIKALVYTEPFWAFNTTDWGAKAGFDQIRNFAGFEIPLNGPTTIEAGYLNQVINQTGGRTRMNHVVALSLWFRH